MLSIEKFLIERRSEPLGLDEPSPSFSWVLRHSGQNIMQAAYQLAVYDGQIPIWSSERVQSDDSVAVRCPLPALCPQTRYNVSLTVWANTGERATASAGFETGLMGNKAFRARWITHSLSEDETACPVFVRKFSTGGLVTKARLYASACGIYDVQINGKFVSEDFFAPGYTSYKSRIQYQTYDVTGLIDQENRLEMTVANGWYTGYFGCDGLNRIYGDRVAALAELHLWYADGHRETILTNERWHCTTGPVRYAEFYHGETVDSTAGTGEVRPVQLFEMDNGRLIAQQSPPVRIIDSLAPIDLIHTPKGEVVLDFGQNLAGVIELAVNGSPGQKIVLRHAEVLDKEGNLYTDNLRLAKATDTLLCKGGPEVFRPRFTYHGFRYIAVEGMGDTLELSAFKAQVLCTDFEWTAEFSCSDDLVNRLWKNICWGQKGNFIDIPTDCSQRDERMGWTGDATVFCRMAAHNGDVYLFFKKWLADLAAEQAENGAVPLIVPQLSLSHGGAAVWSDAATIIPWTMYQMYGDKGILEAQYSSMKAWVEYLRSQETPDHLRQGGHQYGDWLALDREEGKGNRGGTDIYLIATVFYAYSTQILYQTAELLGKTGDADGYCRLYQAIKAGFQKEYITETGRLVSETQTACVLTLYFDLAPPRHRQRIRQTLVSNLKAHNGRLTTGFVGTPYLCHVLSDIGRHDLAGRLLLNEEYPGWLNEIKLGSTTIWERWDSLHADGSFDESGMNSFNHYAFGSIGDWMVEKLAGIRPAAPGYKDSVLMPQLVAGLTDVSVKRITPYGELSCACSCRNGTITVDVTIPVNATASLYLPEQADVKRLGSGSYQFVYATKTRLEPVKYTAANTLEEILAVPLAAELLEEVMPGMLQNPAMSFLKSKSIDDLLAMMPGDMEPVYQEILDRLNEMAADE